MPLKVRQYTHLGQGLGEGFPPNDPSLACLALLVPLPIDRAPQIRGELFDFLIPTRVVSQARRARWFRANEGRAGMGQFAELSQDRRRHEALLR
jgi:hypothetical protein